MAQDNETIAQKIHAHINVLHGKLRLLESYLTDEGEFKCDRAEARDIVEDAVLDLQLCIGCIDRIEKIVKKIK